MVEASAEIPHQAGFDPRRAGLLGEPKQINHPARLETTRSGMFSLKARFADFVPAALDPFTGEASKTYAPKQDSRGFFTKRAAHNCR